MTTAARRRSAEAALACLRDLEVLEDVDVATVAAGVLRKLDGVDHTPG